ncbi:hypothetical protein MG293_004523 [Ovis ammon polii]|uniref:Uncharacterized protein n=1 Tax=Ovis ammon polii TaxID=230172 RepID=A0AAD4YEE1_OVIAM|nr:hypothetical protein MG293_004523 [Ovis ammon polii]
MHFRLRALAFNASLTASGSVQVRCPQRAETESSVGIASAPWPERCGCGVVGPFSPLDLALQFAAVAAARQRTAVLGSQMLFHVDHVDQYSDLQEDGLPCGALGKTLDGKAMSCYEEDAGLSAPAADRETDKTLLLTFSIDGNSTTQLQEFINIPDRSGM